jgi:hypothetical protein
MKNRRLTSTLKSTISERQSLPFEMVLTISQGLHHQPCLANAARIDGTHGIVRATLLVTLDSILHGQTTIKHDVNERGIWQVQRGRQGDSGELQVGR